MVQQTIRLTNAPQVVVDAINAHVATLEARKRRNLLKQSFYDMKHVVSHISSGMVPMSYYKLGLVLGWSGKAVDLLARRANCDGFVWAKGDLDSLGMSELWSGNQLQAEIGFGIISSLILGPAFLINHEGFADEPKALIHAKDALHATGTWNARTRSMDDLLSVTEFDDEGQVSEFAYYGDGFTITAVRANGTWTWEQVEHDYGVPVECMAYKPLPSRPFGRSRISRPMMGLQDAATRTLIRLEGHMDVYSNPEFWMLGADETIFKNPDGSQKDVLAVRLGRIKGIPDDNDAEVPRADVKQFPAADPSPHLSDLNALAKLFAREGALPDTAMAITDFANPTSAEAYDASQYELVAEAEGACDDWTPALVRSIVRGLAMQNDIPITEVPTDWWSIEPNWRDPRYQSRAQQAAAGQMIIASAPGLANTEVGLELLGLTPTQVERAMQQIQRNQGRTLLQQLVNANVNTDGR